MKTMGNKGTVVGLVVSLVTLLLFIILANLFYPLISSMFIGTDPSFQLIINIACLALGIAIIFGIIQDATRGSNPVQ